MTAPTPPPAAKVLCKVRGVAISPGVSANNRMYTAEALRKAVERAQQRIAKGDKPMTMRTHHAAGDDSSAICGRITSMTLAPDGAIHYTADLADVDKARTIATLIAGPEPFFRGVSIRGGIVGPPGSATGPAGQPVIVINDLEIDGVDFTASPGMEGAHVVMAESDQLSPLREEAPAPSIVHTDAEIAEMVQEAAQRQLLQATLRQITATPAYEQHVERLRATLAADRAERRAEREREREAPSAVATAPVQGPAVQAPQEVPSWMQDIAELHEVGNRARQLAALDINDFKDLMAATLPAWFPRR